MFLRTCDHKYLLAVNYGRMAPHVRALVGPACQSLVGPACQSFGGSRMSEICGPRMSEHGGSACQSLVSPTCQSLDPTCQNLWGPYIRSWWVLGVIPVGSTCSRGTYRIHNCLTYQLRVLELFDKLLKAMEILHPRSDGNGEQLFNNGGNRAPGGDNRVEAS
jgi:hypothetical protein